MSKRSLKNVAHSVHQRLLNKARESNRPFNELLQYYAMERFLYRLSLSPYADSFVLKGALMLPLWRGSATRPTRDIDLLGEMDNAPRAVAGAVRDICTQEVEPDGLRFEADSVETRTIAHDAEYRGVRVRFNGYLGSAVVHMQVDVGFGDVVCPGPDLLKYPAILDLPQPALRTYTRETVIAEKLQAMVKLGELNSRMRDFYDIWLLSEYFEFDGPVLSEAVKRTFDARDTEIARLPVTFTEEFASDERNQNLWRGFLRKSRIQGPPRDFKDVVAAVERFIEPVLGALSGGEIVEDKWPAAGPWASQ